MRKIRIPKLILLVAMVSAIGVGMVMPASAANISYAFNLGNTGTTFNRYPGGANTKVYSGDPATVRTYSNNAPGYGFAFVMQYRILLGYNTATVSSPKYWIKGAGITHPVYASGQNVTNRNYYVAARIDNDYSGTYSCSGYFNSDYVN